MAKSDLLSGLKDGKEDKAPADLLGDLKERSEIIASPWKPEDDGDGIQGTVVQIYYTEGEYVDQKTGEFPQIPHVILEDAAGEYWSVVGFRAVLRGEIDKAKPEVGDTFAALYKGQQESKKRGQQGAHIYRVAVRKASGAPV